MILAGDIGGTKTVLALCTREAGVRQPLREERFPSRDYDSLDAMLSKFLADTGAKPAAASFGVAGPIIDQRSRVTNLPWEVDATALAASFAIPTVHLLNDLQAMATAVPHLEKDQLCVLNEGTRHPEGNIGVIAPRHGPRRGLPHTRRRWLPRVGCRYVARPAVAEPRLSLTEQGEVRYTLKTPYRNGTTHVVFQPSTSSGLPRGWTIAP